MDVITTARELGKAIQKDDRFIQLAVLQQANDADTELQSLIGQFNLKRIDLNAELNKTEKDQQRITKLNEEVREIYGKIMSNPNMAAYNAAKEEVDGLIDYVMQILRGSINGEDPDTIERQTGCSGSCDSCSGCH